ncbi:hypothetical protein HER10_EVM0007621 [Colletotrichum scovillei]|uniref:SnoaL-like domain-containing protein n=1 Tax=Colletotrichum scovillei TaxID=1209932 RepID=A0A9P7UHG1_9PEZI|nr:uncharacterized protein HER10_EVM0007621 [Colletotrichum scovillei]KAF4776628.1 hypothetical protein HER10_EVM0007621 [Colletotrichum scovillei]KAG7053452.1 hypothetical protein JMJ77_0000540 [Colletotrichum scovillei]KAG7071747.1 hypothetical protein JMJ76_0004615 [Colletotrichum scovillei]KAG7079966.1 hypothetical protein JMJ78_0007069 [Colletotrichum scovillei]
MGEIFEIEDLERWLQEIRGQSSDRPCRLVQESLAKRLIAALYEGNFDVMKELCAPDVMLLADLKGPGQIFYGPSEIDDYRYDNPGYVREKMAIVDRLRVTTAVEFFSKRAHGKAFKQRRLIILDMNNDHKVIRIEMRPVGPKESVDPDAPIPQGGPSFSVDNSL